MYVSSSPASGDVANTVSAEVVQRTSMNTSLGAAAGGLTALLVAAIFTGEWCGLTAPHPPNTHPTHICRQLLALWQLSTS
jgi:hypothetical protein